MQRRVITPFIVAATVILPACWHTGAALAQSINRPVVAAATHSESNMAPAAPVAPPSSAQPVITRALLPGHWALQGARYVWIPPEIKPRRVQSAALIPGAFFWHNGAYVWVPEHYAN